MTRSWTPPTPNGFWPELTVVGERIFLAYGNAQVYLTEFRWSPVAGLVQVRHQLIDGDRAWMPCWIRPGILTWFSEQTNIRWELDATAADWRPVATADDPAMVRQNPTPKWADGGHWCGWLADRGTDFRLVWDGQVKGLLKGPGHVAGPFLAASDSYPDPNNAIQTWKDGKPGPVHPCLTPLNYLSVGPDGHLAYGFVDLAFIDPSGTNQRIACTPWRTEGVGAFSRHPDGTPWVATLTWNDPTGYVAVLLRPWPDGGMPGKAALVVEAAAIHVSFLPFGDQWLVATCGDRGQGQLQAVPLNTPLQVLQPRVPAQGTKYLGYYYAAGRYGDFRPMQNCTQLALDNFSVDTVIPPDAPARMRAAALQAGAIFIGNRAADYGAMSSRWDLVHGIMLPEGTVAGMEAWAREVRQDLASFQLAAKPVIGTVMPTQVFDPGWRVPAGVDALAVEIYFDGPAPTYGDQLRVTAQRIDQVLARTVPVPVILVPQCYDRNGKPQWQTQAGVDAMEAITAACLAVTHPRVLGCWWFAYSRPGGVRDYPVLETWHRPAVAQATRPAGLPVKPDGGHLTATITGYSPNAGDAPLAVTAVAKVTSGQADRLIWRWRTVGSSTWNVDAVNSPSDPDHTYRFALPGSYEISLRVEGPAGADETGLQRLVTVSEKDDPVDPDQPTDTITFLCHDGVHNLAVEAGGPNRLVATRTPDQQPGSQRFTVVKANGPDPTLAYVGFQGPNGRWVSAEQDGTLTCNRERPDGWIPEAWEAFEHRAMPGGAAAFRTWRGLWVTAEGGGGGDVTAIPRGGSDQDPGIWEIFMPSSPISGGGSGGGGTLVGRHGIVRASGQVLVDDDGPFLAIGTTLFPLGNRFKFALDQLRQNLAYLKGKVHYVRALAVVGGKSWEDRPMDPTWPDWAQVIAGATDLAYDDYGIRVQWSVFGGLDFCPKREDRDRVVQQLGQVIAARPHKVISIEVMNEAWQNGFGDKRDEAKAHCRTLRQLTPCLVSVTAPAEQPSEAAMAAEIESWYRDANATAIPGHLSRSQNGSGGLWRPVRQPWEVQFWGGNPPRLWDDQEPIGPKSSVAQDDDPERLATSAAVAWTCGMAKYLLHTGAGVRLGGAADQGRREANIYEVTNIDAILGGINRMHAIMPADAPAGSRQNSNVKFPDHPFDYRELPEDKVLRVYATNLGDRFVACCIQVMATINLKAKRNMHVKVYHPVSGDLLIDQDLAAGQAVQVSGPPAGAGYVVIGNYR